MSCIYRYFNKFLISFLLLVSSLIYGQTNDEYFGATVTFNNEFNKQIYLDKEESNFAQFLGAGVVFQKRYETTWGIEIGLNYVKRQYKIDVPYNHCYFTQPNELCTDILSYTDTYGYNTLEIPFGIIKYMNTTNKWASYFNFNIITALDFKSIYRDKYSKITQSINELNLFNGSLTGNIGFERNISNRFKVSFGPFIRFVNIQRKDTIIYADEKRWTYFDNFGLNLRLLYKP